MKIVFFEAQPWEEDFLRQRLEGHELVFYREPLKAEHASSLADCDALSVFIYSKVDAEVLSQAPELKLVNTRSTGFDHIDVDVCKARGIVVTNVPHYGENTIAEYTFALLLSLMRHIHLAHERTKQRDFSFHDLEGSDLHGKILGVIGAGNIGLHVIKIARGFGMHVLAYDVRQNVFLASTLGFEYVSLEKLLAESDIITLHAPALPETYHLLNHERFEKLKRGSVIVNTARGDLIDTAALVAALDAGIVRGAALDVLEGEKALKGTNGDEKSLKELHACLLENPRVLLTPHMGFYSREALQRILLTTVQTLAAFTQSQFVNVVPVN